MSSIEIFILSIFDTSMFLILFEYISKNEKIRMKRNIFFVLLGAGLMAGVTSFHLGSLADRILSIIIILTWFRIYTYKYFKSIKLFISSFTFIFMILFSIQLAVIIVINSVLKKFDMGFQIAFIIQSIDFILLLLLLLKYTKLKSLYHYIDKENSIVQVILVNTFLIYFIILILWSLNAKLFIEYILLLLVIFLFVLFVNVFLIKDGLVNKQNKENLEIYETYLPIINSIIEEIKIKQHDYHNQLQTISELKKQMSKTENEYQYLETVLEPDIWSNLILLDNKVLLAFLYSKYIYAKDKNIEIKIKIENFLISSKYTDYELIEIYGILIDNAVEAVSKLEIENKVVEIELNWNGKMNILKVINQVRNFKTSDIQKILDGKTIKVENNKGIGIFKLRRLLKKYNGILTAEYCSEREKVKFIINHR